MSLCTIQEVALLDNERLRYETAANTLEDILEKMSRGTPESAAIGFTIGYLKGRIALICEELQIAGVEI